jgi:translation initiation factor IF-2
VSLLKEENDLGIRVYQLAKKLGISSKELLGKLRDLKVEVKGHMSSVDKETAEILMHELQPQIKKKKHELKPKKILPKKEALKQIQLRFPLTVKELALRLQMKPSQLISDLIKKKIFVNLNQNLQEEICREIAKDYGYVIAELPSEEELMLREHQKVDETKLIPRAPVVTFMGHVDHGKTSLLDLIRKTKVADRETGGITQHIGAYEVSFNQGKVTFLDTPGHEAFTAMRARGAHVTDVVVLVVAADDGVMPQTIEAIDHARAANVPIVVAINKIDKPQADVEGTKKQLADLGLVPEDWGGKTITVGVSAKTGEGIDQLLEMLLLEAEMLELKADPTHLAKGVVIESKLTRGSGPVSTVLVQNGTLKVSDVVICGKHFGRIKALINDKGRRINEAGPSMPVEILGLSGVVEAGEAFYVVENEKRAKEIALSKQRREKEEKLVSTVARQRISLDDLYKEIQSGHIKELKLIIKADVQGSLEALVQSLEKLGTQKVKLKVIHAGIGSINESDVLLAAASNAIIIGFHVKMEPTAKTTVLSENVDVRLYRIIYEAVSDVKAAMEGLLEPKINKIFMGRALVKQVFKVSKIGLVAGCIVDKGKIIRGENATIYRDKEPIFEGRIDSLKHFKNDIKEASEGSECGISFSNFKDIKVGDIIECYHLEKIAQKL